MLNLAEALACSGPSGILAEWMNELVNEWVVLLSGIWEELGAWGHMELGLNFDLPFSRCMILRKFLNFFSFVKWGHELPLSVTRRIRNDRCKCLIHGRCLLKEGFFNSPASCSAGAQWAFRKCLMTEESLAPFIRGHKSSTHINDTSFIYWAAVLSWGSPQSPGWHIGPANQLCTALCSYSEHEQNYLGILFLTGLETSALREEKAVLIMRWQSRGLFPVLN